MLNPPPFTTIIRSYTAAACCGWDDYFIAFLSQSVLCFGDFFTLFLSALSMVEVLGKKNVIFGTHRILIHPSYSRQTRRKYSLRLLTSFSDVSTKVGTRAAKGLRDRISGHTPSVEGSEATRARWPATLSRCVWIDEERGTKRKISYHSTSRRINRTRVRPSNDTSDVRVPLLYYPSARHLTRRAAKP